MNRPFGRGPTTPRSCGLTISLFINHVRLCPSWDDSPTGTVELCRWCVFCRKALICFRSFAASGPGVKALEILMYPCWAFWNSSCISSKESPARIGVPAHDDLELGFSQWQDLHESLRRWGGQRAPWMVTRIELEVKVWQPTNHPFRKENDLPNLHDYVPC